MKILCPTDFSVTALNGIEYAARMAQNLQASLTLMNVQHFYITDGVTMFAGGVPKSEEEARASKELMELECEKVKSTFDIPCDYRIITSYASFEDVIDDESEKYDFIVMGTNGLDTTYQYYFGSNSYRLAKKSNCPVLIVPMNSRFEEIKNFVFASAYQPGDELLFRQLKQFMTRLPLAADFKMHVLHVSDPDNRINDESYQFFCEKVEEALGHTEKINFLRIVSEDESKEIDDFLFSHEAAFLAVMMEKHGFFYRLFHESLVQKLTAYATNPILVFFD